MLHEGPLTWRISKDKTLGGCPARGRLGRGLGTPALCRRGQRGPSRRPLPPDLHVLLLDDLLVLLQKQDERLLLKCHSKTAAGSADSKQTFSPVLKLNAVLVRSVATGAARPPAPC